MPQLIKTTFHIGDVLYLRWPYHAIVMNTFEKPKSVIVLIDVCLPPCM